jgi:hypothetical protein
LVVAIAAGEWAITVSTSVASACWSRAVAGLEAGSLL